MRKFITVLVLPLALATVPPELFSPLVAQKVLATAKTPPSPIQFPQYTDATAGNWLLFNPDTWTTGFFPATLYEMNRRQKLCGAKHGVGDVDWLKLGRTWSTGEIPLETKTGVGHDVGFLSFPFVEELKINPGNGTAITAVKAFATALAKRFNAKVGCTRSWDSPDPNFQVIIDNMMNLEVLFVAEEISGNHTLRDIAIKHADTTIANHIRPDGGTWHVIEYDSNTGLVTKKRTAQGFSDDSTWSRGQAWGIYGYANMHLRTNFPRYLETARRLATYFVSNIPSDGIVPWDFNAPTIPAPRPADSSAATLAVNALLLLSQRELTVGNSTGAQFWRDHAFSILRDITNLAWRPEWKSLLSNGTVNLPANNKLTGIVYGDYYFIRAGNELKELGLTSC
ncbi:glycoside hydrolase family 88 protein [Pleurotus ostreatus PC15]|uniref:Glycoside hydrolase family 88 protein n=1 Tax=Pleurotus ostreatus (strain PC15) TaxID=1137138 RepID=A0A067P0T8_PLEO1|nr:glycoside hydrolase family 88 protein [Pleurotus ostreatus PC15]